MKSKVMDRPLFKGPAVPDDQVENVGIMQGFLDDDDLESMLGRDEDEEYGDEDENNQAMERTPRTPEILMNNLRGDMRSMDARIEELADLVGYNAAMDTPEEVLMLLQPVLAKQGIGGLPAGDAGDAGDAGAPPPMAPPAMPPDMGGMPADMGGMPPAMEPAAPGAAGIESLMAPPAPPPMDQAPVQMRDGGYVQRFQEGSDERGVTPDDSFSSQSITPEMLRRAQEGMMTQRGAGSLKQAVADVMPTYRDILGGGDRRTMQGQALMDIAQAGLNLASGRNAQGANIAGGSFASQLASAAQGLPGKLGERAAQFQQEERAIKLAALKSAESNVESQRKLFSQIVKSAGQSPFGKGDWDYAVFNTPGLMQRYSEGKTDDKENMLIESAIAKAQAPRTEFTTDPITKLPTPRTITPPLIPFVVDSINKRGGTGAPVTTRGTTTGGTTTGTGTGSTTTQPILTAGEIVAKDEPPTPIDKTLGTVPGAAAPGPATPKTGAAPNRGGLWQMSSFIAGPIPGVGAVLNVVPGLGAPFPSIPAARKAAALEVESLISAFVKSGRASLQEQERLREVYNIAPKLFDDPAALRQRLIAIDEELIKEVDLAKIKAVSTTLSPKVVGEARDFLVDANKFRAALNVPPRIYTEKEANALGPGVEYLWQGKDLYRTPPKGKK